MTSEVTGLTVMAANLWHDWPRQHRWAPRLQAVADLAVAYRVDIMLLQEAARTRTMGADEWLARALGMERAYARANGAARVIGFEEGLAILSRYPLREPCTKRLSLAGCWRASRLELLWTHRWARCGRSQCTWV